MSLHFIRPEWLLALVPLALVLLSLWRQHESHSAWNRYIAPHLAKILVTQGSKKSRRPLHLLAFTWLMATFALAGPAVNKQSLPVFAAEQGRVLVMDMSVSMFATDLAPNRLTQAKFRATDLLRNLKEGETGLVAFAGDAFTISPLTRDTGTLLNLLPTLSPEIMPVRGSNLAAGLTQAKTLLAQGGHIRGDIIVMTDGITAAQFDDANSALSGTQYRLAVVAFGTSQGAPIRLPDGQLQRDSSNEVVVASTDFGLLQKLAADNKGVLIQNRTDGNDLAQLQHWLSDTGDAKATDLDGETWQDLGPYLALLLLLPALFSFRQGIVASVGFATLIGGLLLAAAPQPAHASVWDNVWKTTDQQAMQAYQSQDYANAAKQFESPQWRGSAQYKAGDYEQALKTFEQDSSAQGLYNQGNALMQLGKPDKAKERYQAALEKQADFPAAKANLELAEKQLKQQQKQQGKTINRIRTKINKAISSPVIPIQVTNNLATNNPVINSRRINNNLTKIALRKISKIKRGKSLKSNRTMPILSKALSSKKRMSNSLSKISKMAMLRTSRMKLSKIPRKIKRNRINKPSSKMPSRMQRTIHL